MTSNPFITVRNPALPDAFRSKPNLLSYLQITERELNYISARKYSQYALVILEKRGGGNRTISAPNARLKHLQRKISDLLVQMYKPRHCVHGFVKARSALTNAQAHLGRSHLIKLDLKDYFGQITTERINGLFIAIGIPRDVSSILVRLCTLANSLPQGAPTSPIIANMVSFRLDKILTVYAKGNRLRYTRYADDIVLSSYGKSNGLKNKIETPHASIKATDLSDRLEEIFRDEGFEINPEKLYYCGPDARRSVTGYTINKFTNVPRKHVRRVRAILNNITKNGYSAEQLKFSQQTKSIKSLKRSLRGRIEWIGSTKGISDSIFRGCALSFNSLFGNEIPVGPDFDKLADLSTWVIEATDKASGLGEAQGTVFFLKDVGLITAAHCLPANCDYVIFSATKPSNTYAVTIQKSNDHIDLAILNHAVPASDYLELERSNRYVNSGETVQVLGYPDYGPGHKLSKKIGRVTAHPTIRAVPMYEVDLKIYQGNSGGPLLDSRGEVIGICHKGGIGEAHDLAIMHTMLDQI